MGLLDFATPSPMGLLDTTAPSAIRALIEQMNAPQIQGSVPQAGGLLGGPTPAVLSSQMPLLSPPPVAQPRLSMADRIHERMSGLLRATEPKAPAGYEGLLSTDEIDAERPSRFSGFWGAPPKQQYRENLDRVLGTKTDGMKMVQLAQQAVTQQRLQASRASIARQYAARPNETPEQTIERITQMFAAYVSSGDMEMAGKVGEVVKSIGQPRKTAAVKPPIELRLGNRVALLDPETRREIESYAIGPSPRDPNAPDTAKQLRDQRTFQREQQLADDYNKDTKDSREMAVKVAGALSEAPAAKAGDGISQVNLLYAFVSSMDPGTAVREGEIGLVRSSGSLVQQAQGFLAKYTQGQAVTVPPAMIDQMAALMTRRLDGSAKYVKSRAGYYRTRAKQWGVSESVFPELDLHSSAPTNGARTPNPLLGH